MAPELITSSPNAKYGPQADIYSWSILTYAVWTMKTPFVGPRYDSLTAPGLLDLIKRGERPRFEGLGMPLALRSLLQDAWHPSPRLRPHSFNEVLSRITDLKTEKQSSNLTDQSCILRSSNSTLDDSFFVDDDALLEDLVQDEERRRRVTDGAQQLRRLQEQDLERRLSMDAANNGHLEALVGWIIAIPEVTERAAVIGIKKKRLLVRLEDNSERLIKPLLKKKRRAPLKILFPRSTFLNEKKKHNRSAIDESETSCPFTLVERVRFI
mmetsp:Transcript_17138/g.21032  ORF Transcript_17138/g.21032 Transcript_17138/m.21032 type:complete len:268 (+) Transcript_17138:632-1435(+)